MESIGTAVRKGENGIKMEAQNAAGEFVSEAAGLEYQRKSVLYRFMKRGMDIVASCIGLAVLSPVFLATAIAIKLDDGGPVFFSQLRAGKDGKDFKFYKFRSMRTDAEELFAQMQAQNEQTGNAFKIKDDPRITKVGKFIRKYSIDELPQLVNIIKGDMSIVGPRPILSHQMAACSSYEKQRLNVRPGLTCIWQISGRADIEWEQWVELDLKYIREMNMLTDLAIILKTVPVVLSGDGAY